MSAETEIRCISPAELNRMIQSGEKVHIIDIREDHERAVFQLPSRHIPMAEVMSNIDHIPTDVPVVIHCQSGQRAGAVIYALETKYGYTNLYNLEGGINAWLSCFPEKKTQE